MEAKQNQKPMWFIIEHMEEWLYDWCVCEYLQAAKYVNLRKNRLVISNSDVFMKNKDPKNQEFIKKLMSELQKSGDHQNFYFGPAPLKDAFDKEMTNFKIDHLQKVCNGELGTVNSMIFADFKKVCLLDLRAEKILKPSDDQVFDVMVLGGILGDNPPKDRSKPLRNLLGNPCSRFNKKNQNL